MHTALIALAQAPDALPPMWVRWTVLIGAALVFIVGAAMWNERRVRQFTALAERLGLKFHEHGRRKVPIPDASLLGRSTAFSQKGWARFEIEGRMDGRRVAVFEFSRLSDPNKGRTFGYPYRVAVLDVADLSLPAFTLQPEGWKQKVAQAVKGDDIDFVDTPDFSSRFQLRGEDADAVRRLFTPDVREFFQTHRGVFAESVEGVLLYYYPVKMLTFAMLRPRRFETLLREGLACVDVMRKAWGEDGHG